MYCFHDSEVTVLSERTERITKIGGQNEYEAKSASGCHSNGNNEETGSSTQITMRRLER